jgi:hypothetical protein
MTSKQVGWLVLVRPSRNPLLQATGELADDRHGYRNEKIGVPDAGVTKGNGRDARHHHSPVERYGQPYFRPAFASLRESLSGPGCGRDSV